MDILYIVPDAILKTIRFFTKFMRQYLLESSIKAIDF